MLLSLLLHKHPMALLDAVKEAVVSSRGIILQFPLYAGIAGMMTESGLVMVVADWFIEIATPETFPVLTFCLPVWSIFSSPPAAGNGQFKGR